MDKDFRKPYEYDEDERGLIFVFVLMIIAIDIFMTIYRASRLYLVIQQQFALRVGVIVVTVFFFICIITTAVNCYKMKKNMVLIAKTYLVVRTILSIGYLVLLFTKNNFNKHLVGGESDQYGSTAEMITWELLVPLIYTLLFTVFWYWYFTKSKRFKKLA